MIKTRWLYLGMLLALLNLRPVLANDYLPVGSPEEAGFDSERLAAISSFFQGQVDRAELAGIVTLVARHGRIVHFDAVGYQDVLRNIPMSKETMFRLYSMTKPVASTALMMLYEEGGFQLSDPLSRFIPEFADLTVLRAPEAALNDTVALERAPTVQDVLRHTAGFSHGLGLSEYDQAFTGAGIFRPDTSLAEMMTRLSQLPLMNQPGAQYRYSIGPDVALRLVEIISGMAADDYLEQKIFAPLGMDNTGYWVSAADAHRLGPIHWRNDQGQLLPLDETYGSPRGGVLSQPWSANSYLVDHRYKGGSIGLVGTADDYWRFAQALLNGGELDGERILSPRTVELISRNHLTAAQRNAEGTGFGLGFSTVEDAALFGHPISDGSYFWAGAAATVFWIDPEQDLVVVGLTQHMGAGVTNTTKLRGELAALVYAAMVE